MSNESRNRDVRSTIVYENIEAMVRERVQGWIQDILEEEVTMFLGRERSERVATKVEGSCGYRNGFGKPRKLGLMNGTVRIRRPRVRATEERFESKVLPLFARRTRELDQMLPELYLHGLAKGDFELALRGLLGDGAPLSAASIQRLKAKWQLEYEQWKRQDLSDVKLVYQWADGLYVKAGLEKDKAALLIIVGATTQGKKIFLACESGYRESKESSRRGLEEFKRARTESGAIDHRGRESGHLGCAGRSKSRKRSTTVLESQDHQCLGHASEKTTGTGQRVALRDSLCRDPSPVRSETGRVYQAFRKGLSESGRNTAAGLEPDGQFLLLSERTLVPYPHHQCN